MLEVYTEAITFDCAELVLYAALQFENIARTCYALPFPLCQHMIDTEQMQLLIKGHLYTTKETPICGASLASYTHTVTAKPPLK